MTAVCERAGLTQRYFYEHFRSRDDLLGALFDTAFDEMFSQVQSRVAEAPADLTELARAALAALVDFLVADTGKARLWTEAIGDSAIEARKADSVLKVTEYAVAQAEMVRGPFTAAEHARVMLAALIIIGGQADTTAPWLAGKIDLPREEYVDQIALLFALGIENVLSQSRSQANRQGNPL